MNTPRRERVGEIWTPDEVRQLIHNYRAGKSLEWLCDFHRRDVGGIESRLMKVIGENFFGAGIIGRFRLVDTAAVAKAVGEMVQQEAAKSPQPDPLQVLEESVRQLTETLTRLRGLRTSQPPQPGQHGYGNFVRQSTAHAMRRLANLPSTNERLTYTLLGLASFIANGGEPMKPIDPTTQYWSPPQ
jgi:hypothetical protein